MRRTLILFILFCLWSGFRLNGQSAAASWESLRQRPYPQWFTDSKLGIFIHWGVYSVPSYGSAESYGEWYLRGLQTNQPLHVEFMKKNYGNNFSYRDFAPLFKAELFDPDEWADIFKSSGAGYIVLVSKHHDGFCLWPSRFAPGWNSMETGPKRDLVGALEKSVRAKGLRFGLYYSLPEWEHPLHAWYSDPPDSIGRYVEQHMIPQFKELVQSYKPDLLFTDGEWFNSAEQWHARELISWYYDLVGPDAIVNDRWGHGADIGFLTPEYSSGGLQTDRPWAEVRGLGRSFGLNRNEKLSAYMSSSELIQLFVRTVANGGGLIINVGPAADGQIPLLQQERLRDLGRWINNNQEAIYGAQKYEVNGQEKLVQLHRIDSMVHFDWVRNSPGWPVVEDNFTATWTGFIKPSETAVYTFSLEADDGARLYVNDRLLIDKWEQKTVENHSDAMRQKKADSLAATVKLDKNLFYPIRVEYHEKHQNASISLRWQASHQPGELISKRYLFTSPDKETGDGLQADYASLRQYVAYTKNGNMLYAITFEWPDDYLKLDLAKPDSNLKVVFLPTGQFLPWEYAEGQLWIDLSGIKASTILNSAAWTFRLENFLK